MLMTSMHIYYTCYSRQHNFVVARLEAVHKPPKNTGFDLILKTSHLIFFSPHIYVNRLYLILIIFLVTYYLDCCFQHFTNKMKIFCILYTIYKLSIIYYTLLIYDIHFYITWYYIYLHIYLNLLYIYTFYIP